MKSIWYPHYIADYDRDTQELSLLEHGAYRLLLDHHYRTAKPLDKDFERLYRVCRAFTPDEQEAVRKVTQTFFKLGESGWEQSRVLEELNRCAKISKKRAQAANQKWNSEQNACKTPASNSTDLRSQRLAEARKRATHSAEEWQALLDICGRSCLKCGAQDKICKDHIIPIYQDGSDGIDNLQPLCASCNSAKGYDTTDYRPKDWRECTAKRLQNASQSQSHTQSQSTKTKYTSSALVPSAPLAGVLPLLDGSDFPISENDLQQWQSLYPAVSVKQEFRSMKGWLIGNPTHRKTRSGIKRFINTWLAKQQNSARPNGGNGNGQNAADARLQRIQQRSENITAFAARIEPSAIIDASGDDGGGANPLARGAIEPATRKGTLGLPLVGSERQ